MTSEALHYLPAGTEGERASFGERQRKARRRLETLRDFYRAHPCRMARVHLLTACVVTLGRFCGLSASFDALGDALQPADAAGAPRTPAWARYADAARSARPWELRDELWIAAHVEDLESAKARGLDVAFCAEVAAHPGDPLWALLRNHMAMTLGARLMDHSALAGAVAYETAIAQGMALALGRIARAGWALLGRYAWEGARAVLLPAPRGEDAPGLVGYRRCALAMLGYALTAWTASSVYRRGIRARERGRQAHDEGFGLLEQVLGPRVGEVHPMIVSFYTNPARFAVRASLELNTLPARFWSWLATFVVGQGLYEQDQRDIEARFRVFRRADGSMHFVRELYCREALRVFDSDFVVRPVGGTPTLFEVFVDHRIDVEMEVAPRPGGSLSIRGRNVFLRGLRVPTAGIAVEFVSRVEADAAGVERLHIDGQLLMQPRSAWGRFLAYRVLRRPEKLGCIHYVAWPAES